MKIISILLLAFGFSSSSWAKSNEVPVSLQENEVRATLGFRTGHSGQIYYNCDSVENDVEDFLENLGATSIRVRCTGGLDVINPGFTTPANIRAEYTAYVADPQSPQIRTYSEVNLRGHDNCALIAELIHTFKDEFVMTDIEGRGSRVSAACGSSDSYNVNLKVVK